MNECQIAAAGPLAPWRLTDVFVLYAGAVVGATVVLLGWWGASGSLALSTQVMWVTVGVAGVLFAGVCSTAWLVSGRRAVGQRQQQLLGAWASVAAAAPAAATDDEPVTADRPIVTGSGMTRYHRPDCPLVAGKDVAPIAAPDAAALRPCGVCRP